MPSQADANLSALSALIENTTDYIWAVDIDGRLTVFNRAWRQYVEAAYGRQPEVGMLLEDLAPPEGAALGRLLCERARTEGSFRTEFSLAGGRGLALSVSRIEVGGKMTGVFVFGASTVRDLSARDESCEGQALLASIVASSSDAVYATNLDGAIVSWNPGAEAIFGYPAGEIIGRNIASLARPGRSQAVASSLKMVAEGRHVGPYDTLLRGKDGSEIDVSLLISPIRDANGNVTGAASIARDIRRRRHFERELEITEKKYRAIFDGAVEGMFQDSPQGKPEAVNQAAARILSYDSPKDLVSTVQDISRDVWADQKEFARYSRQLDEHGAIQGFECQLKRKDGVIIWASVSARNVCGADGRILCREGFLTDITRRKMVEKALQEAENTIRSLAFYDPLTGLPNHSMLVEKLRLAQVASAQNGRWQAMILIDVDNFKALEEILGNRTANLLLQEVARRLAACARETGIVGRWGGDQFVAILPDLSGLAAEAAGQASHCGENILAAVNQAYAVGNHEYCATASIGITVFGGQPDSTDEILQQADIALHHAKAGGGNRLCLFSPALQAAVSARAALEDDLRQAIKAGQFLLYYQPQVEQGRLTGAEALLRWNHPRRGMVMPEEFIPLAEESRLILPLGDWVLETACGQIAAWKGRLPSGDFTVAVNISALQFRQPEFVDQVQKVIARTGAIPDNLRLELTESILVDDIEDVVGKMNHLSSLGLRFSLDDFGTGYSSLAYLKRLPLDRLKIDQSFVRDILEDSASSAIARAIILLGRAMHLPVIAEGVETEEQRNFLADLGCNSFQGNFYSRPLSLEQFEAFLQSSEGMHGPD